MAEEKSDVRRKVDETRERVDRKRSRTRAGERITLTGPLEIIAPPVSREKK